MKWTGGTMPISFCTTAATRTSLAAATASFTSEQVPSRKKPSSHGAEGLAEIFCLTF